MTQDTIIVVVSVLASAAVAIAVTITSYLDRKAMREVDAEQAAQHRSRMAGRDG